MVEDHDSERLTDVVDAVGGPDDDPIGMRIGPGTEIGGYIIDGELGHGGMGVVYSATHPVIGKRAAIKVLRIDVSRSPIAVERFIQEARAVNQIGHPNIIDIFAYGALPDGRAYHVMDLLVGESLRRRLRRSVLHPSEAASVIDEIASALTAAHEHGFVHRDLKPDNVFLVHHEGRWPEVKLLDFGLAKLMPEHGIAAFITKTGTMLGTPEYMSPEQARGTGVDYRTDIYALGIVMFEILAGHRPFPAIADQLATLMQHAEEPPASLGDTVAGLPDEMVQLVDAMLAKTPEARPSLAAVRTVIKRLRTTQLPTRSVAGAAMESFSRPSIQPSLGVSAPLGVSASRFGAQAVLPGDSRLPDSRISQPQTTAPGVGVDSVRSNPGLPAMAAPVSRPDQRAPAGTSQPPALDPARSSPGAPMPPLDPARSSPGSALPQALDRTRTPSSPPLPHPIDPSRAPMGSQPMLPPLDRPRSPSAPQLAQPIDPTARPSPQALAASPSSPGNHPRPRSPSGPPAPSTSSEALRASSEKIPVTKLGVPPPPRPSAPVSPPQTRGHAAWLAFAALLVVAGAIAVVIALTGT